MQADKNEYIKEAVDEVERINRDKALREKYLKRMMAVMDEESQKESYFEDGLEKRIKGRIKAGLSTRFRTRQIRRCFKCHQVRSDQ